MVREFSLDDFRKDHRTIGAKEEVLLWSYLLAG